MRFKLNLYYVIVIASVFAYFFGKITFASMVLWIILPPLVVFAFIVLLAGLAHGADKVEKTNKEFKDE